MDAPCGHLAVFRSKEAGYGLQGRGLAGAVRPKESNDISLRDRHVDALEDKDDVAVNDFYVIQGNNIFLPTLISGLTK